LSHFRLCVRVGCRSAFGHVAAAILHAAQDHDTRLVVLGSSSRTGLPRILLGSVASRLLHMATKPVLIVPRMDTHAEHDQSPAVTASAGSERG
jgi:nucleotide-binding universal stress UspA family protein